MSNKRLENRRRELTVKVYRAKLNFFSICALTLINIVLCFVGSWELPFYYSIPCLSAIMVSGSAGDPTQFGQTVTWSIVGLVFVAICVVTGVKAVKSAKPIRTMLTLTWIDLAATIVMCVLSFLVPDFVNMRFSLILNAAFHIFVLVFMTGGNRAVKGLEVLPTEDDAADDSDPYAEFGGSIDNDKN